MQNSNYELSDEMLRLAHGGNGDDNMMDSVNALAASNANDADADDASVEGGAENGVDDDPNLIVRTMEVPRWLSTNDVTKHLVGSGKKKFLESEYECNIVLTGHGSGTKDPSLPGFHLPHLLVTLKGTDSRQIGRVRRALEDSLVDFIFVTTPQTADDKGRTPLPPSLGRLLYALALSSANASPKTKDHTPHRTVLARAHYSRHYQNYPGPVDAARNAAGTEREHYAPPTKKCWMNVVELPRDTNEPHEFHGRFLAGKNGSLLEYYRTKFQCRVDIYGVWGEESSDPALMCEPYVLVTSEEGKQNVDRCLQFIEHRIREHEEKWGVSRVRG